MVTIAPIPKTTPTEPYVAVFDRFIKERADEPSWLRALRESGLAHFAEQGFPSTRHEEWKYTDIRPIAKLPLKLAASATLSPSSLEPFTFNGLKSTFLVFVNGHFAPEISNLQSPISNLASILHSPSSTLQSHLTRHARADANPFVALNTAFFTDGAFLLIPRGKIIEDPIHLLFISTATDVSIQPRTLIIAEENSQARIIEHYVGLTEGAYFTNAVTEIIVKENAVIEHCKIQDESLDAFHIATIQAQLARNANFTSHSISFGARIARNNINLVMAGEGVNCILNGLYLAKGRQLVDHHTVADHTQPHCNSHEFYHGILDNRSHGVFNGKIFVRQDAQKTDAKQTNKNLLLSYDAVIDTKPQLEIYADDVKCTHGATVGQLDEEEIFYLRTRGIGLDQARRILTLAFASDIINRIKVEAVRDELNKVLAQRLAQEEQS